MEFDDLVTALERPPTMSRPELSRLLCGEFRAHSLERLFHFLMALGRDIDIVVRPSGLDTGGTLCIAAPELD